MADIAATKAALASEIESWRQTISGRIPLQTTHFQQLRGYLDRATALHAQQRFDYLINLAQLNFDVTLAIEDIQLELPPLNFSACQFNRGLRLKKLKVGGLRLQGVQTYAPSEIQQCQFNGEVDGSSSTFRAVLVENCTFNGVLRFLGPHMHFENGVHFVRCHFADFAYFDNARFSGLADFSESRFFSARFNNAEFTSTTSFARVVFEGWAPQFHGATLHHDTSFAGADFRAYSHEQDWRAYRTLKQKMADVKAQEEESFFFSAEQRARRKFRSRLVPLPSDYLGGGGIRQLLVRSCESASSVHQTIVVAPSAVNGAISLLYDYASNYGLNIARPFLWWISQLVAFAYIFLGRTDAISTTASWLYDGPIRNFGLTALTLSIQNSLNPLSLFAKDPLISVHSFSLFILSLGQAVISLSLIALGILAIRRRFHKGSE